MGLGLILMASPARAPDPRTNAEREERLLPNAMGEADRRRDEGVTGAARPEPRSRSRSSVVRAASMSEGGTSCRRSRALWSSLWTI